MDKEPWVIIGLGNPGMKYERTRHNIGFMAMDFIANKQRWPFKEERFLQASLAKGQIADQQVVLVKPQTYMNLSGLTVRAYLSFFKQGLQKLVVVMDDADLPFGEIRLKAAGGSGGHNGLKSIEEQIGSQEFPRLKVGIGRSNSIALVDYVLQSFSEDEEKMIPSILLRIEEALQLFMNEPIAKAMNRINFKEKKDERREEKPV